MQIRKLTTATVSLLLFSSLLTAQSTLVEWGGDYVTNDTASMLTQTDDIIDYDGDGSADDSRRAIGYDQNFPAFGPLNYPGPAVYAGTEIIKIGSTTANGLVDLNILDNGSMDALRAYYQTPSGIEQGYLAGAFVFKSSSFSTGAPVAYGNLQGMTMRYGMGGVSGSVTTRFLLIDSNGDAWLSNSSISGGNGTAPFDLNDVSGETWALYEGFNSTVDGIVGILYDDGFTFDQTLSHDTQISAVGVSFIKDPSTGFTNAEMRVTDFAITVPEPQTTAILAGLAVLGFLTLRRIRR